MTDRRLGELPEHEPGEPDDDQPEQRPADRRIRELAQRALAVGLVGAAAEDELEREPPDQQVDDAEREEAEPSEVIDGVSVLRRARSTLRFDRGRIGHGGPVLSPVQATVAGGTSAHPAVLRPSAGTGSGRRRAREPVACGP